MEPVFLLPMARKTAEKLYKNSIYDNSAEKQRQKFNHINI